MKRKEKDEKEKWKRTKKMKKKNEKDERKIIRSLNNKQKARNIHSFAQM